MKTAAFLFAFVLPLFSAHPISPAVAEPPKPVVFELRLVVDTPNDDTETLTYVWFDSGGEKVGEEKLHVRKQAALNDSAIKSAIYLDDPKGHYVQITFKKKGTEEFARLTRANVGKRIAILIDGKVVTAPVVNQEIANGVAQILGSTSIPEAKRLAARLAATATRNREAEP